MADKKLQVRALQERDFWRLLKIISKATQSIQANQSRRAGAEDGEDATSIIEKVKSVRVTVRDAEGNLHEFINEQLALELVLDALDTLVGQEDAIKDFLASMVSMDAKKFDNLPIGSSIEIIQEIIRQDGARDFLSKLVALASNDSDAPATLSSDAMAGATA